MHKRLTTLALLAATAAGPVFAADATLTFTGTINPPSCTVDTSTANQTIALGTASIVDFGAVGSISNAQGFNLNLTNCDAGAKVTMTVSGTASSVASVLQNTGTATQVGVQLLKAASVGATTGTPITLNGALVLGAVGGASLTIPMVAQFYRLGTMTAGSVAATATVNFTYN
ncbi:type 1 fimbrial protein [Paraburkholderia sacchari]|nr:type 1 fimbrial protein [Paraburkholderia sacchari]